MLSKKDVKIIKVLIGEVSLTRAPNLLQAILGSCVGVCIYDEVEKLGGLAHVFLPSSDGHQSEKLPSKFANIAIPMLRDAMIKHGGHQKNLKAKIAGGANMFSKITVKPGQHIGVLNLEAVKKALYDLDIPIISTDTGGNNGRKVEFELNTFNLCIDSPVSKGKII
ncbi:MAG: chemotaxis protein CheD [Desulfobacterales bacterium]|nr:chemotaxis protein CheD [Desulfobacterales bacterium]MBF0397433.1 chemotaxis protein CheD [Desulfobacterales bacterium]